MPAIAGQLPTKVEERVPQLVAAGLDLSKGNEVDRLRAIAEALAERLEEAEDTIRIQAETIDELEIFKDNVDDHNEMILGKAYDVVDTCHHSNNMDWITKAMKHVLMRYEFLTEEKQAYITECTRRPHRDTMTFHHLGGPYGVQVDRMVDQVNEINRLREDISLMLAEQILKDLPELITVRQSVSDGPDGTTYVAVGLKPKTWNMRADKKWYSPVDNPYGNPYGGSKYDYRRSDFD